MTESETLFERAKGMIPGGVNSPVRAFNSVGGTPIFMESGSGSRISSVDGNDYIDYCGSWGPLILGHARTEIVNAVSTAAAKGMSFGTCTKAEVEMAELILELIPSMDMVRLVNSGTEATMTAIRLARGVSKRNKFVKFDGCYHGHSDAFLVNAGSGLLTAGISSSAGVAAKVVEDVFVLPYNDIEAFNQFVEQHADDFAGVIVEPIAGNMGLIEPVPGFLQALRDGCDKTGAILIFDEVINGFRLSPGTYGDSISIKPDIYTLGKIIGGGLPIGAIAGTEAVMSQLSPLGAVYQAGTLSGNPVAVAAGKTCLELLKTEDPYGEINRLGACLEDGINALKESKNTDYCIKRMGGVFTIFFTHELPQCLDDVKVCDMDIFKQYFHSMLDQGIYLSPSQYECCFVSAAHNEDDINAFIRAFDNAVS